MAALLACGALTANAQAKEGLRFGVTGGMNVANITDVNGESRLGFNVGVRAEYSFTPNVYFGTGLLFTQKGTKYDGALEINGVRVEASEKLNPGYLELPLMVGYRYDFGNDIYLFGETGPYLAVGVCGKYKYEASVAGHKVDKKFDFFGDDGMEGRRFDAGWGLRAGVEFSSFQVHLGYEYGFAKVWENSSSHNSNFTVGVSYMF